MNKLSVESGNCYFFEDRLNRRYLSGVDIAEGYLLYSKTPVYFTDMRYYSAAKEKLREVGVTARVFHGFQDVVSEIKAQNISTAYIDFTRTTMSRFAEYKKLFGEIKDCSDELSALRKVKSAAEIENVKKACAIAEKAVSYAFSRVREGITELELKKILEDRMDTLGGEGASFDTIIAFGANSAVPHHETGKSRLKRGDVVLIDTGCKVNGYSSDITRTAFFGTPDAEFLSVYDAVKTANEKAEREIVCDTAGKDADKIARDLLLSRGYGEYFTHSLGHGVGLEIHESPRLSPSSDDILSENTVFTVEPGVYIDGKFGVRIEDTCIMQNGKVKRLFKDDKKPLIIAEK